MHWIDPALTIPVFATVAAVVGAWFWVKYIPSTPDDRARWAQKREARKETK